MTKYESANLMHARSQDRYYMHFELSTSFLLLLRLCLEVALRKAERNANSACLKKILIKRYLPLYGE